MADEETGVENMRKLLGQVFAPWVQQLGIEPIEKKLSGALFVVPANTDLERAGGILCGQAISAIADTVGVLTLGAHNEPFRLMTTVDMTTHFMRPVMSGAVEVECTILSNGRRMATLRMDFRTQGSPKILASATCAYAYIEE